MREDFNPARSDIDLLVEFAPLSPDVYAPNYFALMEALDSLRARGYQSRQFHPEPLFQRGLEKEQQTLYAAT